MELFITGATGFIGRALLPRLLRQGHRVRALVRPVSALKLPRHPRLLVVRGDLTRPGRWQGHIEGSEMVLHLVGGLRSGGSPRHACALHAQGCERLLEGMSRGANPPRIVYLSSLGARPGAESPYLRAKGLAEERIRAAGFRSLILRTGLLVGRGIPWVDWMSAVIRWSPWLPLPADNSLRLQPVAWEDLIEALQKTACRQWPPCGSYDVVGPRLFTFSQFVADFARRLGRVGVRPVRAAGGRIEWPRLLAAPMPKCLWDVLKEWDVYDPVPFFQDFYIRPSSLGRIAGAYMQTAAGAG